ncbi:hypothetical protein AB0395_21655 [Streptosporangium sp. NPDC051023]|uniref:hypothetical protein n=1 Tax=Streptosporangium sp. NPDC051023 TaxID=3155410 RepID=UPI00344D7794
MKRLMIIAVVWGSLLVSAVGVAAPAQAVPCGQDRCVRLTTYRPAPRPAACARPRCALPRRQHRPRIQVRQTQIVTQSPGAPTTPLPAPQPQTREITNLCAFLVLWLGLNGPGS